MDLSVILKAVKLLPAGLAAMSEIQDLIEMAARGLSPEDQETAKAALQDIMADNDEGHKRLDAKLAAAERR